jgi:hypothetical protein
VAYINCLLFIHGTGLVRDFGHCKEAFVHDKTVVLLQFLVKAESISLLCYICDLSSCRSTGCKKPLRTPSALISVFVATAYHPCYNKPTAALSFHVVRHSGSVVT